MQIADVTMEMISYVFIYIFKFFQKSKLNEFHFILHALRSTCLPQAYMPQSRPYFHGISSSIFNQEAGNKLFYSSGDTAPIG